MTTIPKPAALTQSFSAIYDAWNRLVKLEDTSGMVAQYEYDGTKRRSIEKNYTSGVLSETRHQFYTEPSKWQVLEERLDTSANPERQFLWGIRYIDDLIIRDRDTNRDATLDERLYSMQDANWNVTTIATSNGAVQERSAYSAYGLPMVLTAAFAPRVSSLFDWETTFAGYRLDLNTLLYCVRNRALQVVLGSWLQRDPLRYADALNLYEYVTGRPTSAVDPSGKLLVPVAVVTVAITVVVAGIILFVLFVFLLILIVFLAAIVIALVQALIQRFSQPCQPTPTVRVEVKKKEEEEEDGTEKCKLIGSGFCNKKVPTLKRCTYSCDGKPAENAFIRCAPYETEGPACPGSDGTSIEPFWR